MSRAGERRPRVGKEIFVDTPADPDMDDFLKLIDLFNRRHQPRKVVDVGKPVITTRMMPEPETVKARVGSSHTGPALAWPG